MDCTQNRLAQPKVVAVARDTYLTPLYAFADTTNLVAPYVPKFGQDLSFGRGRPAPGRQSVGTTEATLKERMSKLLTIFAAGDRFGMARRLFNAFLTPQRSVTFFEDKDLNAAAASHGNIEAFCKAAMSIPTIPVVWGRGGGAPPPAPKARIHQALKAAGWDVNKVVAPSDLGVPAFNDGNKSFSTGDFDNGLGLMINGVQYVYALATHYRYDSAASAYCIRVRFIFYDVFGLDDDDLKEFGADSDYNVSAAEVGITAWWQLQHQFGYAPLVTRVVVEKTYEGRAT
jgi:hypothetical protein